MPKRSSFCPKSKLFALGFRGSFDFGRSDFGHPLYFALSYTKIDDVNCDKIQLSYINFDVISAKFDL